MSINKVIILGNVGKDPEVRNANSTKVVTLTVATSEKWTDRKGEKQERTEWHSVVFFGKSAEFVEKYVRKGLTVYVEGKIRTESYEKDGSKKFVTRIYADSIQLVGKVEKNDSQRENAPSALGSSYGPDMDAPLDDLPA